MFFKDQGRNRFW